MILSSSSSRMLSGSLTLLLLDTCVVNDVDVAENVEEVVVERDVNVREAELVEEVDAGRGGERGRRVVSLASSSSLSSMSITIAFPFVFSVSIASLFFSVLPFLSDPSTSSFSSCFSGSSLFSVCSSFSSSSRFSSWLSSLSLSFLFLLVSEGSIPNAEVDWVLAEVEEVGRGVEGTN